ncbi:MAG TPA: sigma-54 dependent transcriptional regulator [Terriglobales bacterium]|jgi:two-component system response regulator AtoC|nr:sigma-54 dependent transcriptional regulator [Terriglobales bacterium]
MSYSVLVVDDEELTLRTISRGLRQEGFDVLTAATGEDALKIFHEEKPDLTLLDIVLPGMDGVEVLRQIKQGNSAAIVIMMSAYHLVDRAVEAMKLGAYDYLVKPFHLDDLIATMHRATEMLALRVRVRDTVETAKGRYDFGRVVTQNANTIKMLEVARKAAEADHTTILIQGESGTGKGVLAKAIHYASPRAAQPMLELNCAALPDTLLESELFGYEPGAFTDARRRKEGLLERANGGTLFLDEIGNMSASVQAKLLRVLEEGTFIRLGGTRVIKVDVRLIAATNVNLKEAVAGGHFREDLYYRLNVVPLYIPPLRERKQDVLPLALEMLQHFNRELNKKFTGFTAAAADLLQQYSWPGNIRELKNVIERTMILAPEGDIDAAYLPEEIREHPLEMKSEAAETAEIPGNGHRFASLREMEDDYIEQVLAATGHNKTQACRILGIHPTSLLRRLKKEKTTQ